MSASRLEVAVAAAREAGGVLKKYFAQPLEYRQKADRTFVSRTDEEAETVLRARLLGAFSHHAFNGEESGPSGQGDTIWHVDPLDGTANFMNGNPECAVSIGLTVGGAFVLGVVYQPFTEQLYLAEHGAGAFCNGERLRVSAASFEDGLHAIDASFSGERAASKLKYLQRLTSTATKLRMSGSNVLQLAGVAAGRFVTSYSDAIHPWDFAAGVVLVSEAGGVCEDLGGGPPTLTTQVLIAASSLEHLAVVRSSGAYSQ